MKGEYSPLAGFTGMARLFPLPNLVFFPHVMQPLHIFEPRYRQMTADALAGDRLIALVLPRPGFEADYSGRPAIHTVGCLGTIVAEQKLADGRFNLLLRGLSRIQIAHEIPHAKLYRKAKVELLAEIPVTDRKLERRLRREMISAIPGWFAGQPAILQQLRKLMRSKTPLGPLCDIFAFALPLAAEFKQSLLEEVEVEVRVQRLLEHQSAESVRKFPPEFSVN